MKKKLIGFLCVLVTLSLISSFTLAATFVFDFEDESQEEYFISAEGGSDDWWEISDGSLNFTSPRGSPDDADSWSNIITFIGSTYRDFTISFDLDHNTSSYLFVVFGLADRNTRLQEQDEKFGVIFWNPLTTGVYATSVNQGPENGSEIAREGQTMTGDYTNSIRMVKEGSMLRVYIANDDATLEKSDILDGNTPVIEVEVDDLEGYIQFFSGNGECSVSNLSISPITDAETPAEETPVEETSTPATDETDEQTPQDSEPETDDDSDDDSNTALFVVAGLVVVIIAVSVITFIKKKK